MHTYVDENLKVWTTKPESTPLPTLLPWIEERFEDQTYEIQLKKVSYCISTSLVWEWSVRSSYLMSIPCAQACSLPDPATQWQSSSTQTGRPKGASQELRGGLSDSFQHIPCETLSPVSEPVLDEHLTRPKTK